MVNHTLQTPEHTPLFTVLDRQGRRPSWLAERLGVSPTLVTFWCSGRRRIREAYVPRIAELLGVTEEEVTGAAATGPEVGE